MAAEECDIRFMKIGLTGGILVHCLQWSITFLTEYISGPRVKLVQIKAFKPPVVYTTDRSKLVVPMLFLFCVALLVGCVEA